MKKVKVVYLKGFLLIALLLVLNNLTFAQDSIETTNGQVIYCKIVQIDSTSITYSLDETTPDGTIEMSDIVKYRHNGEIFTLKQPEQKAVEQVAKQSKTFEKSSKHLADSIEKLYPYFVYTFNDQIITGEKIECKKPFLEDPYIIVDSKRIQSDMVKFYKNENGFFANTKTATASGRNEFVQRFRKGKINLYEKEKTRQNSMYVPGPHGTGMFMGGGTITTTNSYYNVGFDVVKKPNYKNLIVDMADNPECEIHLEKIKANSNAKTAMYVIGGCLFTAGFATIVHKTKDWDGQSEPKPNVTFGVITFGSGFGMLVIGSILTRQSPQLIRNAINSYNR